MSNYDKYARLYCSNCKSIWSKTSIGTVLYCTKCGKALVLKSFNPWMDLLIGAGIISLGIATILYTQIPIMWIGGFLWGGQMIINGFRQWQKIKVLDGNETPTKQKPKSVKYDRNSVIITCGRCFKKLRFSKGKGIITAKCPNCLNQFRITT